MCFFVGVPFSIANLKDMIMNSENKVKIRPILLAVTGLPDSGDSDAISHLLKYHAEKSPYLPMSRKSYSPKEAKSITYYELVAVGVHRLQIVEVTSEFSCSFGIMSAFKKKITENSQLLKPTAIHVAGKKQGSASQSFFNEDPSLERHLEYLFQNLSQFEYLNDEAKESNLTPEEKEFANHIRKLPSGTSLINIWNISINTTTLSCLTALSGYLYRSNTWAFLDIERDMDKLDQPPEPHHGELQITKWRPRLHYLLRVGKMSHGSENGADREGCCTVFARHDENFNGNLKAKVKELEKDIKEAAKKIGVADLFESKVQPINFSQSSSFPDDQSQHLYQKLHQLICETPYKEVPLSWLFLRSLFYQQREKIIISKSALKAKAGCCGIDEAAFEEFCQFYASFGSIIDFTLINPDHNLIVLSPIEFLRTLDRILQPNEESFLWKHPMTEMGIVSERLCNILFEVECSDYMDALISFGLAVKVTSCIQDKENVLQLDKSLRTEAIYFVPQLRKRKSTIRSVDPNAVYFVTSIDSPTVNKETQFVKHMLALHPTAVLIPCHERNKTIIHDVDTGTTITMVSFSPATMISISNPIDKVHESVVRACHEIAQSTKALKYKFVIICAKRNKTISPSSILSCCCHVLPNEELECDGCTSKVKNLKAWNNALQKVSAAGLCFQPNSISMFSYQFQSIVRFKKVHTPICICILD